MCMTVQSRPAAPKLAQASPVSLIQASPCAQRASYVGQLAEIPRSAAPSMELFARLPEVLLSVSPD